MPITTAELIAVLNLDTSKFDKKIKKSKGVAGGFGKYFAGTAVIGAIVLGMKKAIASFAEFENRMLSVQTLLDGDAKTTIEGFTEDILNLTKEIPLAASDMASALFDIVSAGIPAGEAIEFLTQASKLAVAGVTDAKTAVIGMTKAYNIFSSEQLTASQIADKFFSAQKKGQTTIRELSSNLGKVAPIAASMNISFDETISVLAAMTTTLDSTEEASTSFKNVLVKIANPTSEAKKEAAKYGIELSSQAVKTMKLIPFLEDMNKKLKAGGGEYKDIFKDVRAFNGILAITNNDLKAVKGTFKSVSTEVGINQDKFEEQAASMKNQYTLLQNHIATKAKEIMKDNAEIWINPLLQSLNKLFVSEQNLNKKVVKLKIKETEEKLANLKKQLANSTKFEKQILMNIVKTNINILSEEKEKLRIIEDGEIKSVKKTKEKAIDTTNIIKKENKEKEESFSALFSDYVKQLNESGESTTEWSKEQMKKFKDFTGIFKVGAEFGSDLESGVSNLMDDIFTSPTGLFAQTVGTGLEGLLGSAGTFLGGGIGGIIAGGIGQIVSGLFGAPSKQVKDITELADDAFEKLVKNTNRAIAGIGKERGVFEQQFDVLKQLEETNGKLSEIPTEFLSALNSSEGTTVQEAMKNILESIMGTNDELKQVSLDTIEQNNKRLDELKQLAQRRQELADLGIQQNGSNAAATKKLMEDQGLTLREAQKKIIEFVEESMQFSKLADSREADRIALERENADETAKLTASSEQSLSILLDNLNLQEEIKDILDSTPEFSTGGTLPRDGLFQGHAGEEVLSKSQQSNLFDQLNNPGSGGSVTNNTTSSNKSVMVENVSINVQSQNGDPIEIADQIKSIIDNSFYISNTGKFQTV